MPLAVTNLSGFGANSIPPPLDIISSGNCTGAFSFRRVRSAYGSGSLYTLATGISNWQDQSGNNRDMTNGTGSTQPGLITLTQNPSITAADFNGSDEYLSGNVATDYIDYADGYAYAIIQVDAYSAAGGFAFGDYNGYWGLVASSSSGNRLRAYCYDGADYYASRTLTTATTYVVEMKHGDPGADLDIWVNNDGSTNTTLGGNAQPDDLTGAMEIGRYGFGADYINCRVAELFFFDSPMSSGDRELFLRNMAAYAGVVY